jgi:hypothetical protein
VSGDGDDGPFDDPRFIGRAERARRRRREGSADADMGGLPKRWGGLDRTVIEAIELGGVQAERVAVPRLAELRGPGMRGRSSVLVEFRDPKLHAAFRRTGSIVPWRSTTTWTLVRRWAEAEGSAELDEAMCFEVVRELKQWFDGRLRAWVATSIEGRGS